ncbi:cation transporter [Sulfitobacter pseudonitzschiae]|uniref:Protein p34 n=2 Tax=Rhodobacterales TaxID=204455 RepID=A0A9Q2NLG2_9RHOB|nr:cation diffusion facilitator family transporter [Pseudosulfitobacter pseudonitzschiae]MBM2294152.1 cation transporter [Pseudosulfitobacter pseudonitzschiae]MBM2299076.1 cation transporter [Pseudosulfitobacter pseudonitzschiae]MBM2303984.1 cation transporter [Pseudosulfitobacter pseudonitzschiae]MBM2313765.1 cation transporter [Pseudosulfitobacter pseudonitzschiae]MBM2318680.1 cation transporter [Pseudosulfitobacter pseudonitzschiae]|tara:strand:- start:161 stop:1048 length:888 start_codon:yes stop_codon:yes gene_type:complete
MTTIKLAIGSIFVGFAVLGLKTLAYWLTGSVALLSDALESTVNVATAFAALIAIRVAAKPADADHPWGHHKAEFFSAVLEGVMIIVAALLILHEAYAGFMTPAPLDAPLEGLLINMGATVINGIWAWVLVSRGRAQKSPALVADGKHLVTDVLTSVGVAAGVLLAVATGWWILDPLLAALVAVNILWSGWKIVRDSLSGLMDEAVSEATLARIREIIATQADGATEAHDLRTRHAGAAIFIDFHLVVPGETTVFEAHEICDRIENALKEKLEVTHITIHVEPEHKSKQTGIIVLD